MSLLLPLLFYFIQGRYQLLFKMCLAELCICVILKLLLAMIDDEQKEYVLKKSESKMNNNRISIDRKPKKV